MTRIEKAVKDVSDLYEFYRHIPKISVRGLEEKETRGQTIHRTARGPMSRSHEARPHRR